MTYHKYGIIQAATYNTYAGIINSIYADTASGSIQESVADFGYGLSPTIPTVAIGNDITAAQWTALFSKIHTCGAHQGTNVSPIPTSVAIGDLIAAYNDYLSTQTLSDVVSLLTANRLQAVDLANITGPTSPSSPAWGNTSGSKTLSYQFQIDFLSWNNARHFFNSGSSIGIFGACVDGAPGTENHFWHNMFAGMGTLKFSWHDTIPFTGAGSNTGFYDLLAAPTWVKLYERSPVSGGVYYSSNFIAIYGQLADPIGTSGKVNIKIDLVDNDPVFDTVLANSISYNISLFQSAIYPGPSVNNTAGTYTTSANYAFTGIPLTLTSSQLSATAVVDGGVGTATTPPITITPAGGIGPYTYSWVKDPLVPSDANLTFSAPTSATSTVSYLLGTEGQIASATVKVGVTDSTPVTPLTAYVLIPVSFNSNPANVPGT